ncbi:MAG TPA: GPW/gp25 family protein [Solirubrobacteraceae bacterium]|nr:GPW/gp25 family protein [Solirubrobacteraceae bacterium]
MSELIGSGLAFPLHADQRGALALTGGVDDIEQAIALILGTAPGERPMRPAFGCAVHDVVFDTVDAATIGKVQTAVHEALERWEPRIEVTSVDVDTAEADAGKLLVEITYRVRATSSLYNLVYPFYVIPAEELL